MTREDAEHLARLYEAGMSITAISTRSGIPCTTIRDRKSAGWRMVDILTAGPIGRGVHRYGTDRAEAIYWHGNIGGSARGWALMLEITVAAFHQREKRYGNEDPRLFVKGRANSAKLVKKWRYVHAGDAGTEDYRALSDKDRSINLYRIKSPTKYDALYLGER